jgi:outer membrane protein assembly factor BamB
MVFYIDMNILKTWIVFSLTTLGFFSFQIHAQEQGVSTQPLWQLELEALPESANSIFYGNTVIYYLQNDQLHVKDLQTGEMLWQMDYPLSETSYTLLPVSGDGLIFVPKAKTLEALDERTGKMVWSYESRENLVGNELGWYGSGVYFSEGYLFVNTETYLTALDTKHGDMRWTPSFRQQSKVS